MLGWILFTFPFHRSLSPDSKEDIIRAKFLSFLVDPWMHEVMSIVAKVLIGSQQYVSMVLENRSRGRVGFDKLRNISIVSCFLENSRRVFDISGSNLMIYNCSRKYWHEVLVCYTKTWFNRVTSLYLSVLPQINLPTQWTYFCDFFSVVGKFKLYLLYWIHPLVVLDESLYSIAVVTD